MCSAGSGYLIPGLIRECQQLVELTGDQGDVLLMHPFVMHRVSGNPSGRARFSELHSQLGLSFASDPRPLLPQSPTQPCRSESR